MTEKPKTYYSESEKQIDKAKKKFDEFDKEVQQLSSNEISQPAQVKDVEPQTKMSSNEIASSKDTYLKPHKVLSVSQKEKFNENFRDDYNFQKEYVQFIAEHTELIGEMIEVWTKPFPGVSAEFWQVPTNKPVWGPRYLAEQIKKKSYRRLSMKESFTEDNHVGSGMYGKIVHETTVQRLNAIPVSNRRSVFMGKE